LSQFLVGRRNFAISDLKMTKHSKSGRKNSKLKHNNESRRNNKQNTDINNVSPSHPQIDVHGSEEVMDIGRAALLNSEVSKLSLF
uniref:PDZ domain-containing protein n=1 Tax=Parascaris univalens TaxID=6257 RepID=A0A914ZXA1_PARUN